MFKNQSHNDNDEDAVYDMPPRPMPKLSPAEQKQQDRKFHRLLVFVIFQTLVIIGLFIAVMYKVIEIATEL